MFTWNPKCGAVGCFQEMYKGWEISVQHCAPTPRRSSRWYVIMKILDPNTAFGTKAFENYYDVTNKSVVGVFTDAEKKVDELIIQEQSIKSIDKRNEGFYCTDCGRFSQEPKMTFGEQWVNRYDSKSGNYVTGGKIIERWLVKVHYDGCRGWN